MCCGKYFSVNWMRKSGFVPILILFELVMLSNAVIPGVVQSTETPAGKSESGPFSPAHRHSQGRETLTTIRSSSVVVPRNFTVQTASTTRLTVAGVNNLLKSRLKRPGVILSLSLRSKDPKQIAGTLIRTTSPNPTLTAPSREEVMTSTISDLTQAAFGESKEASRKNYKILDRLRNLTNLKMKAGSQYGMKKYDSAEEVPAPTTQSPPIRNDSTRVGGHLTHHNTSLLKPSMNVQVHSHGTEYAPTRPPTTPESEVEAIEQVETRFVTAEQVGGNRPTKTPFHFTTTTPAPSTTTTPKPLPPRLNRYTKPYSPHNHIYAPTQNPISVAHNEDDLTVEDFRDFRAAHSAFGSRVNSGASAGGDRQPAPANTPAPYVKPVIRTTTPPPTTPAYRAPPPRRPPPPANNPIVIKEGKIPKPVKPVQLHPQSASSGVKNSHVKLKKEIDPNNDNLPFYKEPGGVFEHKYTDNDNEPNEINTNFRAKGPGVKYAPQGPSAQPQSTYNHHVSNSPPRSNHYQHHNPAPPPTPQYVAVTQQPIYLTPVPVQPIMHHQPHQGYNPIPQSHYYPAQPQPHHQPHPQPYYPSQAPPVQYGHSPVHSHGHAPIPPPPTHYTPIYHQQPQPAPPPAPVVHKPQRPPPVNPYLQPRPALPAKKIDQGSDASHFDAPPSRDDPRSDYYYGDPRPPKPKPTKKPVAEEEPEEEHEEAEEEEEPEEVEEKRKPERDDEEDDQEYRKNKPSRKQNNKPRYSPPPRRPNNSPSRNRGKDRDYEEEDANGDEHRIPPVEYYGNDFDRNPNQNRDREPSRPPSSNSNNDRRPQPAFDDYDSDPNEHIDDFVRPSGERPQGSEDRDRGFGDFDYGPSSRSSAGQTQPRPFYPSEQDRRFRPSSPDIIPNFDHPNIEYPQRRPPAERPYSPARSGRYDDNPTGRSRDVPSFDPIYTRTIKQFDEENQPPPSTRNNNYRPAQDEPHYDDGSPKGPDDYANIGEPEPEEDDRRGRGRDRNRDRNQRQEVEEEEEPEEDRGRDRGRTQTRQRPAEEEEEEEPEEEEKPKRNRKDREEEEEEEEEETQQDPKSRKKADDEEEEEEEEEEEDDKSTNNTPSTSNQKEDKKPPPKKPQQEKSGDLDDDITGIEREFGGYFDPENRPPSFNVGSQQLHPVLSQQN